MLNKLSVKMKMPGPNVLGDSTVHQLPLFFLNMYGLRLAPLKHCKDVSEAVQGFAISGISIALEADSKPTSVFAGVGSEDNAG